MYFLKFSGTEVVLLLFANYFWGAEAQRPAEVVHRRFSESERLRLCEDDDRSYGRRYYHNRTRQCYFPTRYKEISDQTTPCGELQSFVQVDDIYGICACKLKDDETRGCGCCSMGRPVLNWPGSGRCYFAYLQGPCEPGEWIVMNPETYKSECVPNPCVNMRLQAPVEGIAKSPLTHQIFWFYQRNQCYQTYTRAFCRPGEYVKFAAASGDAEAEFETPICYKINHKESCVSPAGTTAPVVCQKGLKAMGNSCVQVGHVE